MKTQKLKIDIVKKILAIENPEIIESIAFFVNQELDNDYSSNTHNNQDDETQKGIETILKMVQEFK